MKWSKSPFASEADIFYEVVFAVPSLGGLAEFNDEPEGDGGSAGPKYAEPTNSATTLIAQQTSLCNDLGCSSAQKLKVNWYWKIAVV